MKVIINNEVNEMFRKKYVLILTLVLSLVLMMSIFANAKNRVTIRYVTAGTAEMEMAHNKKWVDYFNKMQDEIYVEYEPIRPEDYLTKVYAYVGAGDPPDVAWAHAAQVNEWYHLGLLEPLDGWLGERIKDYYDFLKTPVNPHVREGKHYALPFTLVARAHILRGDWMKEAGIDDKDMQTWDGFIKVLDTISEPKKGKYGFAIPMAEPYRVAHSLFYYLAPGHGLINHVDFRPEKRADYIEMLKTLKALKPYMPPAQSGWSWMDKMRAWTTESLVAFQGGTFSRGEFYPMAPQLTTPEKMRVVPIPCGGSQKKPVIAIYTVGYTMFKNSKKKEHAAKFIEFMTQPEVIGEWPFNLSPMPKVTIDDRVKVLGEDVRWWEEQWHELMNTADVVAIPPYSPATEIDYVTGQVVADLLEDKITPEAAYERLKKEIEALMAEHQKR